MAITITSTKPNPEFMSRINVGDYIEVVTPNDINGIPIPWLTVNWDTIRVVNVDSNTSLVIEAYYKGTAVNNTGLVASNINPALSGQNITYKVMRYLTLDQQIDHLIGIANNYNSNRTSLIWPPVALWYVDDNNHDLGMKDLGAPSIAACYAAAKTAYPAQQGFTNMPFQGPYQLKYSNDYFNRSQLNRLSASGWAVFVQETPGAPITCRHQLASDGTEVSIVQQIDKVSIDLKEMLRHMIGIWNINEALLTALTEQALSYLFSAKNNVADRVGGLIQDYQPPVLRANLNGQNLDLPKTMVEMRVNISFGWPFNNLDLIIRGE